MNWFDDDEMEGGEDPSSIKDNEARKTTRPQDFVTHRPVLPKDNSKFSKEGHCGETVSQTRHHLCSVTFL